MEPHKFGSIIRKRQENSNPVNSPFDATILDMTLDSQALFDGGLSDLIVGRKKEAIDKVFVALASEANQELAHVLRGVRTKSQSGVFDGCQTRPLSELLMRAVRCAAKQYMLQAELSNLAVTDELTGLYNRRGFMVIAERQLKLVRRSGKGMLLFFVDVNGLKQINDPFAHAEGDRALKHITEALEEKFRDSDVIARMGGDEFVVLAIEAADFSESTIRARLGKYPESIADRETRYLISIRLGAARFDPSSKASLANLIDQADHAMYKNKRNLAAPNITPGAEYQSQ